MHTDTQITLAETIDIAPTASLAEIGAAANRAYDRAAFALYRDECADRTLAAHAADLGILALFLLTVTGADRTADDLAVDPSAWTGFTRGMMAAFRQWLINQAYSVGTINRALSTVRVYAKLAAQAGAISPNEIVLIQNVGGISAKSRIDERRQATRRTRIKGGVSKKTAAPSITDEQLQALLHDHEDSPRGRRDAVMMAFLLDHGLRAGELEGLTIEDIDLDHGRFHLYREKVQKKQTHDLSAQTMRALFAYVGHGDAPAAGPLLRTSTRGGGLGDGRMTRIGISQRVAFLGRRIGVDSLSAHDCRHYWTTRGINGGTPDTVMMDAGGWSSRAMLDRYREDAKIANRGLQLGSLDAR